MEEKKPIKISLSTFFLILAIIVIAVMAYFMFKAYSDKGELETQLSNLNTQNEKLSKEVISVQTATESAKATTAEETAKTYSYKDVKGVYKYTTQDQLNGENFDIECTLYLYEDGTFNYSHAGIIEQAILGNYILDNDWIILNKLFRHGNDLSLGTAKGQLKLKMNSDGTITDTNNSFEIEKTKNITLSRITTNEAQYMGNEFALIERINACIKEGTIYNGEAKN